MIFKSNENDYTDLVYTGLMITLYSIIFVIYYIQKLRAKISLLEETIVSNNCAIKLLQKDIDDTWDIRKITTPHRYALF